MALVVRCSELGVKDCHFEARGDTPEDILEQIVPHLRREHHIDMPDPDVILSIDHTVPGRLDEQGRGGGLPDLREGPQTQVPVAIMPEDIESTRRTEEGAVLIVRRLREVLGLRRPTE